MSVILRHVPGFGGYVKQEQRRESDQLVRNQMADALQRAKARIDDYAVALTSAAKIDDLPSCEKLRTSVDHAVARIRSSVQGYSGLFDMQRIDEDRLEDVYDCDAWLLDEIDALARDSENLRARDEPASVLISQLLQKADEIQQRLDQRKRLLQSLAGDS